MIRYELYCPKCGEFIGRQRIMPKVGKGGSDFTCQKCSQSFVVVLDQDKKRVSLMLVPNLDSEEIFCIFCGKERSAKSSLANGFTCSNSKCLFNFDSNLWTSVA